MCLKTCNSIEHSGRNVHLKELVAEMHWLGIGPGSWERIQGSEEQLVSNYSGFPAGALETTDYLTQPEGGGYLLQWKYIKVAICLGNKQEEKKKDSGGLAYPFVCLAIR